MALKIKTAVDKVPAKPKAATKAKPQTQEAGQVKKTAKAKAVEVTEAVSLTETQALVNELVHLEAHMKELEVKAMMTRHDEVKKRLQSIANELFIPDNEAILEGTEGKVVFSPRRTNTAVVDRDLMIEKLTPEVFMQVANVTITDLKKYLAEGEIMSFAGQTYGARSLKMTLAN